MGGVGGAQQRGPLEYSWPFSSRLAVWALRKGLQSGGDGSFGAEECEFCGRVKAWGKAEGREDSGEWGVGEGFKERGRKRDFSLRELTTSQERSGGKNRLAPFEMTGAWAGSNKNERRFEGEGDGVEKSAQERSWKKGSARSVRRDGWGAWRGGRAGGNR